MQEKLSNEVTREVKKLLPVLRKEIKKEFDVWHHYTEGDHFKNDELVLQTLPYAAYEYIILCWGVDPARVSMTSVVGAINNKLFSDLRPVTAHALRRLASVEMNLGRKAR
jgi:hypothetical protein